MGKITNKLKSFWANIKEQGINKIVLDLMRRYIGYITAFFTGSAIANGHVKLALVLLIATVSLALWDNIGRD